jgi:hypothetical protein
MPSVLLRNKRTLLFQHNRKYLCYGAVTPPKKEAGRLVVAVAVGISIARHPPHRPVRALLTHTVLTLDIWRRSAQWDMGGEHESQEASGPDAS